MSDEELSARVDAAAYLCSAATYLDRYDEAVAHAERALRLGRAAGHLHPTLLPALGAAHFMRGRLGEAAKVLDDGVEAARLAGHHPEHGVDAAQPRPALGRRRRPPGRARDGRGGAGADATARRERPVGVGGDGGRAGVGDGGAQPTRRRRPRRPARGAAADPGRLAGDGPRGPGDGLRGPRPRRRGRADGGGRRSARGRPRAPDGDRLGAARRGGGRPARRRARRGRRAGAGVRGRRRGGRRA